MTAGVEGPSESTPSGTPSVPEGVPAPPPRRQARPAFKVLALIGLLVGLAIATNRLWPIGERQAIDSAMDFATRDDPAFRREAYRAVAKFMDNQRPVERHWDVVLFDRATGRRYHNFHFIVYTNNGECVLIHRHDGNESRG